MFVVEAFIKLLDKPNLPDILMQTVFWVLGEYGYVATSMSLEAITDKVCAVANEAHVKNATRGYAVSAALKLTAQLGRLLPQAANVVERFASSSDVDLAQRCNEFRELSRRPATMTTVLPVDASSEDIDVSFRVEAPVHCAVCACVRAAHRRVGGFGGCLSGVMTGG